MNIASKFFMFIIIVLFAGCSSNSQSINSISYNFAGGETGHYIKIEITKDSINGMFESLNQRVIIKEKTPKNTWDSLTHSITLENFKEIKSGKSLLEIDGTNVSIKVETDTDSYSFLNGNIDKVQNKKVFHFMEILENELSNIYERANH